MSSIWTRRRAFGLAFVAVLATAGLVTSSAGAHITGRTLVRKLSREQVHAVLHSAHAASVHVTATETRRLRHLRSSAMTVNDAQSLAQIIDDAQPQAATPPGDPASTDPIGGIAPVDPFQGLGGGASASSTTAPATSVGACWDGIVNNIHFDTSIVGDVFDDGVGVSGYCEGPGYTAIVSVGDWYFPETASFPGVCFDHNGKYHGGEGTYYGSNSTWIHSLHTLGVGIGLSSGVCENLRSVSAAYRAAYNGDWDCYNDWGFGGNYGCGSTTYRYGPYS